VPSTSAPRWRSETPSIPLAGANIACMSPNGERRRVAGLTVAVVMPLPSAIAGLRYGA
jgi:hypothetical protein